MSNGMAWLLIMTITVAALLYKMYQDEKDKERQQIAASDYAKEAFNTWVEEIQKNGELPVIQCPLNMGKNEFAVLEN